MSTPLVNRATGETEYVEDAEVPSRLASNKYVQPDAVAVRRLGADTYTSPEQLKTESAYTTAIDPARAAAAEGHQIRKDANTGVVASAKAFAGGAIEGLSFGALSPFDEAREFNPKTAFAGELAGVLAPSLIGDEAPMLGLLGKGAVVADDALTAERVAGSLSSKLLVSGEAAGDARGIERAVVASRKALDDVRDVHALPDVAELDIKGLKAAKESEVARIEAERVGQAQALVEDLGTFRREIKEEQKLFLATKGIKEAELPEEAAGMLKIQEIGKTSLDADRQIDRLLRNPKALAESPKRALSALQQQETALEHVMSREGTLREIYAADTSGERAAALDAVPDALQRNRELQGRIRGLVATPTSPRLEAIANAQDILKAPQGARKESLLETMLGGSVFHQVGEAVGEKAAGVVGEHAGRTIGHVVGAKAAALVKSLVFGHVGGVAGEAAAHAGKVVETIVGVAKRAARAPLAPAVPVLASKVLAGTSFGAEPRKQDSEKADLPTLYQRRSQELRSLTAYDDTGTLAMKPDARAKIAEQLRPIAMVSPTLADRMETVAARRVSFLASKLPKMPDAFGLTGHTKWKPSNLEIRSFARYVAAAEDPSGVEHRVAHGRVSPEDVEAYRAIYPERAAALTHQIMVTLPTLEKPLPYQHRLALTMLTGAPIDPAMHPVVLAALQGQFAREEGSDGGMQAPRAQPQFGSVKKAVGEPTPSERRAEGM